jgi:uncharacterized protein (DUF58 family)
MRVPILRLSVVERRLRHTGQRLAERARPLAAPARRRVLPLWRATTALGRVVAVGAVLFWLLGVRLGWVELFMTATLLALLLVLAALFTLGRASLGVHVEVERDRVFAGTRVGGDVIVTNLGRRRLLPLRVELPVGRGSAPFDVPSLAAGAQWDAPFVVPTQRRAVVPLGPATSVRGDPLGLLRRTASVADRHELFVHPPIVPLGPLGAGLLRDLEGRTTRDLSSSDLAFHALREYVPGDDRRHVHWRSSARASALSGSDTLLVRQFLDTRRSRLTVVVDGAPGSYTDADDFETAMSVAASLGVRALNEELDLTVVAADVAITPTRAQQLLDRLAAAEQSEHGLDIGSLAQRAAVAAGDTSVAVLVTGNVIGFAQLRAAAVCFGPDVSLLAVRIEPEAPAALMPSRDMSVLVLPDLASLPLLFAAGLDS